MSDNSIAFRIEIPVILILGAAIFWWYRGKNRSEEGKKNETASRTPVASGNIVVTGITIYPIKACRGIDLQSAQTDEFGFVNDRRWMIVSQETKRFVTQRQTPKLALVTPSFEDDHLVLRYPNESSVIKIPLEGDHDTRDIIEVGVWADTVRAVDEGDQVAEWLCRVTERNDLRLVKTAPDFIREIPPETTQKDLKTNSVSFADAFPFLLASQESLADLNQKLEGRAVLDMRRFRPNIVVKGIAAPYDEDWWHRFYIGDVVFRTIRRCTRCKVTTVNPDLGQYTDEPLATLATYRKGLLKGKDEVCFASNLVHEYNGTVHVGDVIQILDRKTDIMGTPL